MSDERRVPLRSEQAKADTWDLSSLYESEAAWERGLGDFVALIPGIEDFKGRLGASKESFAKALAYCRDFGVLEERLQVYASLRQSEDQGEGSSRGRYSRFMAAATRAEAAWAWLEPEIMGLDESFAASCLADPGFAEYEVFLRKMLRFKPHILSEAEERLLALQAESAEVASDAFSVLVDVDLDFGELQTPDGMRPLTQSSYQSFMRSPDRNLRRAAYFQFYRGFESHKNTLAALYSGSVMRDKYKARARGFPSARAAALFPDDVSEGVYDNLVAAISANLPALHEYYELRKAALGLDELRHYDVYVPLAPEASGRRSYAQAVASVCLGPSAPRRRLCLCPALGPPRGALGGPLREQGQGLGRLLLRLLHGRSLHPPQLQGGRPPRRLHDSARGRALDALMALEALEPLPLQPLHDLRGGGREHLQRAAPLPLPLRLGRERRRAGLPRERQARRPREHPLPPDHVRGIRASRSTRWPRPRSP